MTHLVGSRIEKARTTTVFHVRSDTGEPVYLQLARQIKHAIASGALRPGDRMPTIRDLASELVVNPNTVQRAYRELERAGLLEGGPRRGTFVTFDPPGLLVEERRSRLKPHIQSLAAEATVLGFSASEVAKMIRKSMEGGQ